MSIKFSKKWIFLFILSSQIALAVKEAKFRQIGSESIEERCSWEQQYKKISRLGQGGFASAFLVEERETQKAFVLKIQATNNLGSFEREVRAFRAFKKLGLDFVAKMSAVWTCKKEGFILMERLIPCLPKGRISKSQASLFLKKVIKAINSLHDNGWSHGDIKEENTSCTIDGVLKLIDFGNSRPLTKKDEEKLMDEDIEYYNDDLVSRVMERVSK